MTKNKLTGMDCLGLFVFFSVLGMLVAAAIKITFFD